MVKWAEHLAARPLRSIGQRILIVDASSFSMSDAPALREHFGLPPGTHDRRGGLSGEQAPGFARRRHGAVRADAGVGAVRAPPAARRKKKPGQKKKTGIKKQDSSELFWDYRTQMRIARYAEKSRK
jgi:hypothetical protein